MPPPNTLKKWDSLERDAELERISATDIDDALAVAETVTPEQERTAPIRLADIAGNVLGELNRRLGDPELAKDIPGTGLAQLALKLAAAAEEPEQDDRGAVDILQSLDSLPPEHAQVLLRGEIIRLRTLLDTYETTLLELETQ